MHIQNVWKISKFIISLPVTLLLSHFQERRARTPVSASTLFVDMCASSWLKGDDLWIWQRNIYTLHARASKIVRNCKGTISKTIGDCVMAYFVGAQHEQNAVTCAAAILDSFKHLYNYFWGIDSTLWQFQVTVGVSSGDVYFLYRKDPYGPPVDLAARVQSHARPGTAVFLAETIDRIKGTELYDEIREHLEPVESVFAKGFGEIDIVRMI